MQQSQPVAPPGSSELAPGPAACGITLTADLETLLAVEPAEQHFLSQVTDVLGWRIPLAIRVHGLGDASSATRRFETFCARLAETLNRSALPTEAIELTLSANQLPIGRAWPIRRERLGAGALNIVFDPAAPNPGLAAWRLRHQHQLRLAFSPIVRSACPLLSSEYAPHLLPGSATQVPGGSAWLIVDFDLGDAVPERGAIDLAALGRTATELLDAAERRFEQVRWPTSAMRQDAWLNRRVAVRLLGIGKLVAARTYDPGSRGTLTTMSELIAAVRLALVRHSRHLAQHADTLPAIAVSGPCQALLRGELQSLWQRRWSDAVSRAATRHRNLLLLSPWSLFPAEFADIRYANLLPLLSFADACEFRRDVSIKHWNFNVFKDFHCRARAALRVLDNDYIVAERL